MKTPSLQDCQAFLDGAGPRNSLQQALLAKLNAHELRAMARQEAASAQAYLDSKAKDNMKKGISDMKAYQARTGDYTLAGYERHRKAVIAKPAAVKPASRPAPRPAAAPAPAPAAKAPAPTSRAVAKTLPASPITRSVFAKLTPAEKMAYFKTGGKLI
jgi:hypothetical protein